MSEVAKGTLHSILRLEVSQLSKSRDSDFGTTPYAVFGWAEWVQLMDCFFLDCFGVGLYVSPELCFISVLIPDLPVYVNVIFADARMS